MLREMSIRNLAVIEEVNVSFHRGFHVLTGETGAGKSILIDALSLIIGGRGSADMVRYGCEKAEMEGLFDLDAKHPVWAVLRRLGIEASAEEMLIIRRELGSNGKSSSRVNGQLVTMTMLREIGECLVNIHGQHEHQSLLKTEQHLEWLDLFAGDLLIERKQQYQQIYGQLLQTRVQLKELEQSVRQNAQMLDLYNFQIEEITEAALKQGEDEELLEEKRKLMFANKRMDAVSEAYDLLQHNQALDALSKAMSRLQDIVSYDERKLSPLYEQLESAFYQAEDVAYQLRDYQDQIESDPDMLEQIENRLMLIQSMKRKYGESIADILIYLDNIKSERDTIENRDDIMAKLMAEESILYKQAVELATELSQLRIHAAFKLSSNIEAELNMLQMPGARFAANIQQTSSHNEDIKLNANGMDEVVFMLSSNQGEPLKPLNKIASGGEMSRIMLALKSIFAEIDHIPVLVFDEVDTGVSGRAAQAIAEKMSRLARTCQVFSITHLPQVACMADHHYEICKHTNKGRTATDVTELVTKARIEELARMLGGVEVTEKTRNHAQEMLDLAHDLKGA